ncbi:hypothetical protein PFLUOLIPICF7_21765 [Pseudomonas simiae]|jgi:hypothetical protein|uniref:Uncharacterized protein n=1 Tax=Pseudomonas simiae TaxID=321846 RepID=U1SQG3_9PSED|nr:hypothetical protein PFLUOLIPICF7_21765 [Pseudomonas simiae]ERH48486.1 hypothetical protein O204_11255 [Pseudomonas simiae]
MNERLHLDARCVLTGAVSVLAFVTSTLVDEL